MLALWGLGDRGRGGRSHVRRSTSLIVHSLDEYPCVHVYMSVVLMLLLLLFMRLLTFSCNARRAALAQHEPLNEYRTATGSSLAEADAEDADADAIVE